MFARVLTETKREALEHLGSLHTDLHGALLELAREHDVELCVHLLGSADGEVCIERTIKTGAFAHESWWAIGERESDFARRRGRWSARAPMRHHIQRLAPTQQDMKFSERRAWMHGYFMLDGHIVAHVAADGVTPAFAQLAPWAPMLACLALREEALRASDPLGFLITTATGRPLSWSPELASWFEGARRGALLEHIRDAIDSPEGLRAHFDEFAISLHELTSGVSTGYLVRFFPRARVCIDWARALTPLQSQIVQHLLNGDTVKEAAARQGTTTNNVKYHLKRIYDRLGVSTRAELIALLQPCAHS